MAKTDAGATRTGATGGESQDQVEKNIENADAGGDGAGAGGGGEGGGEGAGAAAAGGEGARVEDPRMAAMDRIAGSRREALAAEGVVLDDGAAGAGEGAGAAGSGGEGEGEGGGAAGAAGAGEGAGEGGTAKGDQITRQAGDAGGTGTGAGDGKKPMKFEDLKDVTFLATVDGQEREQSLEDLVRRALKGEAADFRLQQATEVLTQAKKTAEDIQRAAGGGGAGGGGAGGEGTGAGDGAAGTGAAKQPDFQAIFDLILDGNVEEGSKQFAQAIAATGRTATPDVESITSQVLARVTREIATVNFLDDFKDVTTDKRLARMVDAEFFDLIGGPDKAATIGNDDYAKALRGAGERVREFVKGMKGEEKKDDDAGKGGGGNGGGGTREERKAAKEKLDNVSGTGARAPSAQQPAVEQTPQQRSSVIAEIAAARGQGPAAKQP